MTLSELFVSFKTEAFDADVDPNEEYYWDSLSYGFAIAKGCSRAEAFHLSLHWSDYCTGRMTLEQVVGEFNPNIFDDE